MICQTNTQLSLDAGAVGLGVSLDPEERSRLHAAMVLAGDGLRKLRLRKLSRDSHQRRYKHWGHIDRLKARDFRNSSHGKTYYRQYERERRKKPKWHFRNWLYGDINRCLRRQSATRSGRTEAMIGCTIQELMKHLESQFTNGFSWKNRASWHVDHFVPTSLFDLTDPEEQRWAFHYRNMRPMDGQLNRMKSNKLPSPLPSWLPAHIAQRILARQK